MDDASDDLPRENTSETRKGVRCRHVVVRDDRGNRVALTKVETMMRERAVILVDLNRDTFARGVDLLKASAGAAPKASLRSVLSCDWRDDAPRAAKDAVALARLLPRTEFPNVSVIHGHTHPCGCRGVAR